MSAELIQRWDVFLGKIKAEFERLTAEAKEGCLALLDLSSLDPIAMTNAWTGIRAELYALQKRVDTMWSDKVEAAMRGAGMRDAEIDRQEQRGHELGEWIDHETEVREIDIFATAGERILQAARDARKRPFKCTQCSAELPIPQQIFRSVHVTCTYCNRVNTWEPGTQIRMVEHFCGHHLSQQAALAEWNALKALEVQRRHIRGDEIGNLKALEQAWRRYWEKYFRARAALVPQLEKDLQLDIDGRMRAFYDEMKRNTVWNAHAGSSTRAPR